MATITVEAYDGVNDPVMSSFDVVVVETNSPPTSTGVDPIKPLVDTATVKNKLYMAAGTITREFKATIDPGSIGTGTTAVEEAFTLRAFVGTEKVVSVSTPVLVGVNTYSVDIKALKPSISDAAIAVGSTNATEVSIFAKDSFGAER